MKLKEALSLLFAFYEKDNKELFAGYLRILKDYDEQTMVNRIEQIINNRTRKEGFPMPADIINAGIADDIIKMEQDWQIFLDNMCNNYKFTPIPDWVYTIKKHLGEKRCEDVTDDDLHWLKKDFEKIYPMVMRGLIQKINDPLLADYRVSKDGQVFLLGGEVSERFKSLIADSIRMVDSKIKLLKEAGK